MLSCCQFVLRSLGHEKKSKLHRRLLSDLPELLRSCDYVCNVLPSTAETRGLLCGDVLRNCLEKVRFEC